jgi:hypothetical protein
MTINLTEIALKAQEKMPKYKELGKGVSFGMKIFKGQVYTGTILECINYLNTHISNSAINMTISYNKDKHDLYIGYIALVSYMCSVLYDLEVENNEKN